MEVDGTAEQVEVDCECCVGKFASRDACAQRSWVDGQNLLKIAVGGHYTMVRSHALAATHIAVFVHTSLIPLIRG